MNVSAGELEEPFDRAPPTDGPLEKLPPHLVLRARRGGLEGERKDVWSGIFAAAQRKPHVAQLVRSDGAECTTESADAVTGPQLSVPSIEQPSPTMCCKSKSSCSDCTRMKETTEASLAEIGSTSEAAIEAVQLRLEIATLREELVAARSEIVNGQRARATLEMRARESDARAEHALSQLAAEKGKWNAETRELRTVRDRSMQRIRELQEEKESEVLALKQFHAEQVLQLIQRQERYVAAALQQKCQKEAVGLRGSDVPAPSDSASAPLRQDSSVPPGTKHVHIRHTLDTGARGRVAASLDSLATPSTAPPTPMSFAVSPPTPSSLGYSAPTDPTFESAEAMLRSVGPGRGVVGPRGSSSGLYKRGTAPAMMNQGVRFNGAVRRDLSGALDTSADTSDWRGQLDDYPEQQCSPERPNTPPKLLRGSIQLNSVSHRLIDQAQPGGSRLDPKADTTASIYDEVPGSSFRDKQPGGASERKATPIEHVLAASSAALHRSQTRTHATGSDYTSAGTHYDQRSTLNASGFETNPVWNIPIVPLAPL